MPLILVVLTPSNRQTAFGIMLGNIMGVAFLNVGNDLNWRLMLGSTVVLPLIVCAQVYFCPESPRWLIKKNRIDKAFDAFRRIRTSDLQAARDLYYCYVNVETERDVSHGRNLVKEMFTIDAIAVLLGRAGSLCSCNSFVVSTLLPTVGHLSFNHRLSVQNGKTVARPRENITPLIPHADATHQTRALRLDKRSGRVIPRGIRISSVPKN